VTGPGMIVPHGLVQLAANLNFGPELRTERIRTKLRCQPLAYYPLPTASLPILFTFIC